MLSRPTPRTLVASAVVFLGAFLLFQVQPLVSKTILPWYGGSPTVWTTCLLFFQILLVGGYGYAGQLSAMTSHPRALLVHSVVLIAACGTLPISRMEYYRPSDVDHPTRQILILLTLTIGLVYFTLSTTAPLVQSWYVRRLSVRSPYRLYALSNIGSLGALLTYPLLVEPWLSLRWQGLIWSIGFCIYAALTGILMWITLPSATPVEDVATAIPVRWIDWTRWLLWPMLAATLLLAITNQICQNIAVIPFLWIAPLSVYLFSFILCFDSPRWYRPREMGVAAAISLLWLVRLQLAHLSDTSAWYVASESFQKLANHPLLQIASYLVTLFLVSMVCHGELARSKPSPDHLARFYLSMSLGGALGGLLVAIVAPLLFDSYYELNLTIALALPLMFYPVLRSSLGKWLNRFAWCGLLVAIGGSIASAVGTQMANDTSHPTLKSIRNFYGVLTVTSSPTRSGSQPIRKMYSGSPAYGAKTLHGYQDLSDERRHDPTTYYGRSTGIGLLMRELSHNAPRQIGIVGLGVGTLAAYGRPADVFRFYEINPAVAEVARNDFTYLSDSAAKVEIELGDGRLLLDREDSRSYDLLVIDAFTGDTIPTHLLTREAFALYLEKHLKPTGTLAIHVSNRYVNLVPPIARLADHFHWPCFLIRNTSGTDMTYGADWVILTRNHDLRSQPEFEAQGAHVLPSNFPLWTDQYHNLMRLVLQGPLPSPPRTTENPHEVDFGDELH